MGRLMAADILPRDAHVILRVVHQSWEAVCGLDGRREDAQFAGVASAPDDFLAPVAEDVRATAPRSASPARRHRSKRQSAAAKNPPRLYLRRDLLPEPSVKNVRRLRPPRARLTSLIFALSKYPARGAPQPHQPPSTFCRSHYSPSKSPMSQSVGASVPNAETASVVRAKRSARTRLYSSSGARRRR